MAEELSVVSSTRAFGGTLTKYEHQSESNTCPMRFQLFVPPCATDAPVPVLLWLTGLTGTENNCMEKGGAFIHLVQHGVAFVTPDTSTRVVIEGDDRFGWWFGRGASYYLDATAIPFNLHYNMQRYITQELPALLRRNFSAQLDVDRMSISGHSIGGFGALQIALRHPTLFRSVSAFAPVTDALNSSWCQDAFQGYLGSIEAGEAYSPLALARSYSGPAMEMLIDQGEADEFLEAHLKAEAFLEAAKEKSDVLRVDYTMHQGYNHSYYFISTFMGKHVEWHAKHLHRKE